MATSDIRTFLKISGSKNLQEVLVGGSIVLQGGTAQSIAPAIILRLNEPPYQADSITHHTLLGEFLCILLKKPDFVSPSDEDAKEIRDIIRTYNLGPPSCSCSQP